ncbi:MAG TPA: hypothetical protein VG992_00730 [Candidatus Saccharimonadales bacterium]|nr:hypothetical protein [Candidatus Saccharimonadales bacterium]
MADEKQQWPSEDEDFDAITNGDSGAKAATKAKTVTISTPDEEAPATVEAAAAEPESQPEAPAEEPIVEEAEPAPVAPAASSAQSAAPKTSREGNLKRTILEVVLFVLVVALGLSTWKLYSDNKNLKSQNAQLNNNPAVAVQKQTKALLTKVGQLIQLPSGETPTIANVTDAAQAKKQSAFFSNAQNGDKVLMYVKAGEAILYRPNTNKIILVAPLTFTNNNK